MKSIYLIPITLILFILQSCYKEEIIFNAEPNRYLELPTIFKINGKACCFDHTENSLRYPIDADRIENFTPLIEFQKYSVVYFEGNILQNASINNLGEIVINKKYSVRIETQNEVQQFSLTFTNIPIVQVITQNTIFDEPKTMAKIIVNYTEYNKPSDKFFIGIEFRGGTSQSYQKKSFGFSLKGSINLDDNISDSFFDMHKNNDWILDAMWIDNARLRNKSSFELWKKLDGDKHYGICAEFVELYINNEHQGLYCLEENINAGFLNLTDPGAVLYKATNWEDGATCFETYNNNPPLKYYWDGWEQKYPDPGIVINWQPLDELRKLVVNENNEIFTSQIISLIDLNNFIDYYIFLNIVSAMDNTGKNTFLVKENAQSKFCIVPWDIDGSWGLFWNGTPTDYTSILSNNLFNRLLETNVNDFKNKVKQRWFLLRKETFSNAALKRLFTENFAILIQSDILNIENKKWSRNIDIHLEKEYLLNWTDNRILFLDNYYNNL